MPYTELHIDDNSFIIENELAENRKKYLYVAKAPEIENVVFSGGGAKGVVYPGVVKALENKNIKNVAGSSIGAITAALYATSISGKTFADITTHPDFDFSALLGPLNSHLHKTGGPLLEFLRDNINNSILNTIKEADKNQFIAQYNQLSETEKLTLHKMLGDEDKKKDIEGLLQQLKDNALTQLSPITFSMLNVLSQFNSVKGIDNKFKDLSITSVNKEEGALYIFNAENTPDLEIALASRASASLPVFLEPVEIPNAVLGIYSEGKTEGSKYFFDGGLLDNIPKNAVDNKQTKEYGVNIGEQGQNLHTLVFVFDETTDMPYSFGKQSPYLSANDFNDPELFTPGLKDRIIRDLAPRILTGLKLKIKTSVAKARGLKEISTDFTQRNVPLFVSGVGTTGYAKAKAKASELIAASEEATEAYFKNHSEEAIYLTFDNPHSLLLSIPQQKLQALIDEPNSKISFSKAELESIKNFRRQIAAIINTSKDTQVLSQLTQYLHSAKIDEKQRAYFDFIADQLRTNKKTWNEVLKKKNQPANPNKALLAAITKRVAQDKLLAKQRELLVWIDKEINNRSNKKNDAESQQQKANTPLLDQVRQSIIQADNFEKLSNALSPIKDHFQGESKKLTMLSLFQKPSIVMVAEKNILALDETALTYDAYLAPAPTKPSENTLISSPAPQTVEKVKEDEKGKEKEVQPENKIAAVIDITSIAQPSDTIRALTLSGITNVYFLTPMTPDSLYYDIRNASGRGREDAPPSPQPIIKAFQEAGFNVTVITPADSPTNDKMRIPLGSTYREGIQPYYDHQVVGDLDTPIQMNQAVQRALSYPHYISALKYNVGVMPGQESPQDVMQMMQEQFASQLPADLNTVLYLSDKDTLPEAFNDASEDVTFIPVKANLHPDDMRQALHEHGVALKAEQALLAREHFVNNELWKNKLIEILNDVHAFGNDPATDAATKDKLLNLDKVKDMHGTFEEKAKAVMHALDTYTAEVNAKQIEAPLREIKGELDNFISRYGKGPRGLYLKVLDKLDIQTLTSKKMEFAKRYSERIDTVLVHDKLRNATGTLLNQFYKDHASIYKGGNEADKQNPSCRFRECISRVIEPLTKLDSDINPGLARPSLR